MNFVVRKADRGEAKPIVGLYGESGTGKTFSSLLLARGHVGPTGRIVMIETEAGRGEAFSDMIPGGYDVLSMRSNFSPVEYGKAITAAEEAKADALIIDSGSHEWSGPGGVLAHAAERQEGGLKGVLAWQKPKLDHQRHFMLRLMQTPIALVVLNLRAKYPMVERAKPGGGKEWVRSEILEPDQAADILFELFVHGWLDHAHRFHATKYTRPDLADAIIDNQPITIESGQRLAAWAKGSTVSPPAVAAKPSAPPVERPRDTQGGADAVAEATPAQRLQYAATRGSAALRAEWEKLGPDDRTALKTALDTRHKRTAAAVDRVNEKATT
jgi:hypothetical protein